MLLPYIRWKHEADRTGVSARVGFPRALIITDYTSANLLLVTLDLILSVTNLSRLECAETIIVSVLLRNHRPVACLAG